MFQELGKASLLIFLSEMGDKTQMLAMAFALRYSIGQVLSGVALGALCNHSLAVVLGVYLAQFIPLKTIQLTAAFLFLVFGFWILTPGEAGCQKKGETCGNPVLIVAAAFFVGELGDKTQLAAIALASKACFPLAILAGTVLGMVLTSSVGMLIGLKLGRHIPEYVLKLISSGVFIGFGLSGLWSAVTPRFLTRENIVIFGFLFAVILFFSLVPPLQKRRERLGGAARKFR